MDINDYISRIVEPTFLDFQRNPRSGRHAFLACVVVYHSVDYASYPNGTRSITEEWQKESIEFAIVDIVANHLKHVKSKVQKIYEAGGIKDKIPLHKAVLKEDESKEDFGLDLHNLYFCIRDSIRFIKNWSERHQTST